jgi:hypothetical protein
LSPAGATFTVTFLGNIVRGSGINDGKRNDEGLAVTSMGSSGTVIVANNIFYDFLNDDTGSGCLYMSQASITLLAYNNTLHSCYRGIFTAAGSPVLKNNIVQATTTPYSGTFDAASTNNLSNSASAPGSNARTSASVSFVNAAADNFLLNPADTWARNYGENLAADGAYPFSSDILMQNRVGTWDIGAHEVPD